MSRAPRQVQRTLWVRPDISAVSRSERPSRHSRLANVSSATRCSGVCRVLPCRRTQGARARSVETDRPSACPLPRGSVGAQPPEPREAGQDVNQSFLQPVVVRICCACDQTQSQTVILTLTPSAIPPSDTQPL